METPRQSAGRKPIIRENPQAHLIHLAIQNNMPFIDDAIMAGLYISVGESGGVMNVRPRHMRRILTLPSFTAKELESLFLSKNFTPICQRTARYLAAAGRVALGGIERHFRKHPALVARLQAQWDKQEAEGAQYDAHLDQLQLEYHSPQEA